MVTLSVEVPSFELHIRSASLQTLLNHFTDIVKSAREEVLLNNQIPAAAAARGQMVCCTTEGSAVSAHMHTSPPRIRFCSAGSAMPSIGSAL